MANRHFCPEAGVHDSANDDLDIHKKRECPLTVSGLECRTPKFAHHSNLSNALPPIENQRLQFDLGRLNSINLTYSWLPDFRRTKIHDNELLW